MKKPIVPLIAALLFAVSALAQDKCEKTDQEESSLIEGVVACKPVSIFKSAHTVVGVVGNTTVDLFVSDRVVEGTFNGEPVSLFSSTKRAKIRLESNDVKLTLDRGVKVEVKSDHDP